MKRTILPVLILTAIVLLSACSPAPLVSGAGEAAQTPVPVEAAAGGVITTDFEDATSLRNQLAYGTLLLEGSPQAITPEQAQALLPLWQAMISLSGSGQAVPEELGAVQDQIIEAMQPEQLQAIAGLRITNARLNDFYTEKGIAIPAPVEGQVPGAMKNLPEEARQATREARQASGEATGTGAGQASRTALYEEVVSLLTTRAAE